MAVVDENTIPYTYNDVEDILEAGIDALDIDFDKARTILFPFIPANGPVAVDYGIYTLQYALMFGNEILQIEKNNHQSDFSMPGELSEMFGRAKQKMTLYEELVRWGHFKLKHATDQMKRANSMVTVSHIFQDATSSNLKEAKIAKMSHTFLASAYKDLYEITFFLELLLNLHNIANNKAFSEKPFHGIKHTGKYIVGDNGFMNKGLALDWLKQQANDELKFLLSNTYNSDIRKLAGHNNYTYSEPNETYILNDNEKELTKTYVSGMLTNLSLLQNALRLETLRHYYELESRELPGIWSIGYMDWRFNKDEDELLILQYWSNFIRHQEKTKPMRVSFYLSPAAGTRDSVCLSLDEPKQYPYDLRVIPSKQTLRHLERLSKKSDIDVILIGVAPMVEPFTKMSKTTVVLHRRELTVLNEMRLNLKVDKESLLSLIAFLKSQKL